MSTDRAVLALLADLATRSPESAAWARRQYDLGTLDIEIDYADDVARLSMAALPTIELPLPVGWLA